MRQITLFEIGDKVSLTPAWVAMHANEEDARVVESYTLIARNAIGVVKDITFHGDSFGYSIIWKSKVHPYYCAWFEGFEVCEPNSDFDWEKIPFDEYRDNIFSENHESKKQFRKEMEELLQKNGNTQCRMKFSNNILTKEQQDEIENHFNNKL